MVRGAVHAGVAARGAGARRPGRRPRARARRTSRCSPSRTASRRRRRRSARSSPSSRTGCAASSTRIEADEYLGKLNGATGTFGAHVVAVPGADWAGGQQGVRRAPGPDLEPADHADRVARLAGRAVRGRRAVQPGAAQPRDRRVDLHLARRLHPDPRRRARPAPRPCRTRSTRSGSRTPRRTSSSRRRCSTPSRATLVTQPAAARPHRLHHAAQHRPGVRALAARDRQRAPRPARAVGRPRPAGARARRELGGARRARPVGDARGLGRRASPAWRTRTSGSRSSRGAAGSTADDMREFIGGLGLPDDVAARLAELTPASYTGLAAHSSRPTSTPDRGRRRPRVRACESPLD